MSTILNYIILSWYSNWDIKAVSSSSSAEMSHCKPLLIPWLREHVNSNKYPGVQWTNQERTEFSIPWKHALRQDSSDADILIFKVTHWTLLMKGNADVDISRLWYVWCCPHKKGKACILPAGLGRGEWKRTRSWGHICLEEELPQRPPSKGLQAGFRQQERQRKPPQSLSLARGVPFCKWGPVSMHPVKYISERDQY